MSGFLTKTSLKVKVKLLKLKVKQTQEQKLSVFLTKTPQDIRKRCFKLEKAGKARHIHLFRRFLFIDFSSHFQSASKDREFPFGKGTLFIFIHLMKSGESPAEIGEVNMSEYPTSLCGPIAWYSVSGQHALLTCKIKPDPLKGRHRHNIQSHKQQEWTLINIQPHDSAKGGLFLFFIFFIYIYFFYWTWRLILL